MAKVKEKEKFQPVKVQAKKTAASKKLTAIRESAKLANPSSQKSPKKCEHLEATKNKTAKAEDPPKKSLEPDSAPATKLSKLAVAEEGEKDEEAAKPETPPASALDPALLMALNLSVKKKGAFSNQRCN